MNVMRRRRYSLTALIALAGVGIAGGMAVQRAGAKQDGTADDCLLAVHINPEARVKTDRGAQAAALAPGVWRSFQVRFENEARVTAAPRLSSPNAPAGAARDRWLDIRLEPAGRPLTGARFEYRTLFLRGRDPGLREASFSFDVGQGTQDIGFRGEVSLLFRCVPEDDRRVGGQP